MLFEVFEWPTSTRMPEEAFKLEAVDSLFCCS
jgi:hypothetical protein